MEYRLSGLLLLLSILATGNLPGIACADGSIIGKIYSPYVQPQEREIETIYLHERDDDPLRDGSNMLKIGYGQSLSEYWFGEISFVIEDSPDNEADIDEIELEALWQLTEQGEYDYDWGMLFEAERSFEENINEVAAGVIIAREWGRWTGTTNIKLIYEGGSGIEDEFETSLEEIGKGAGTCTSWQHKTGWQTANVLGAGCIQGAGTKISG